ncbi:MAG: hypothetical protein U0230_21920 [Polyangiales bacterium]
MTTNHEGRVLFEQQHHPVVILRMPSRGSVTAIHDWYDEVERILRDAKGPIALVHDLRPLEIITVSAAHRQAVAERTNRLRSSPHVHKLAADARILSNAVLAGAVTAVSWLTGSTPWPQASFSSDEDAIAWSRAQLAKHASSATTKPS